MTRSVGAQLASVDPAVWEVGVGVAATIRKTIRLQREAVARLTIEEIQSSTSYKLGRMSRFDRNRKALAEVVEELRNNEGVALSMGVLCRCAFQLFTFPLKAVYRVNLWPETIRIVAVAIASLYVSHVGHELTCINYGRDYESNVTLRPLTFAAAAALGFFASGRIFVV